MIYEKFVTKLEAGYIVLSLVFIICKVYTSFTKHEHTLWDLEFSQ
jgi:hypothetical protein